MDADAQDAVKTSRRGPARWMLWAPWVIPGLLVAFVCYLVGAWFWLQRPVQFEERDLYGTWVSSGPQVTQLDFRPEGLMTISGDPLPYDPRVPDCPSVGEYPWEFFSGYHPRVSVGRTCGQLIYAENGLFTTDLVLSAGDPDDPRMRIAFTRR